MLANRAYRNNSTNDQTITLAQADSHRVPCRTTRRRDRSDRSRRLCALDAGVCESALLGGGFRRWHWKPGGLPRWHHPHALRSSCREPAAVSSRYTGERNLLQSERCANASGHPPDIHALLSPGPVVEFCCGSGQPITRCFALVAGGRTDRGPGCSPRSVLVGRPMPAPHPGTDHMALGTLPQASAAMKNAEG